MSGQAKPKPPVVMIHGAFCGPWSLDGFKQKFEAAGYNVHAPCLALSRRRQRRPRRWAPPAWPITPPTWKRRSQALGSRPILVGHSMGGLLAQMLAARAGGRRADAAGAVGALGRAAFHPVRDRRRPGACCSMPATGTRCWSPTATWRWPIRWTCCRAKSATRCSARLVPESGRATFEIMHWGLDMSRASEVDADAGDLLRCCCWPAARTASIRPARWRASPRSIREPRHP